MRRPHDETRHERSTTTQGQTPVASAKSSRRALFSAGRPKAARKRVWKRVWEKAKKTGQTAIRSQRSGGRTQESRMDDVSPDSRGEREKREEGRTRKANRGKLPAWARW